MSWLICQPEISSSIPTGPTLNRPHLQEAKTLTDSNQSGSTPSRPRPQPLLPPWLGLVCASRVLGSEMGSVRFGLVQSLSRVRLFATPCIAACQASLSITNSRSSLRLSDAIQPFHPLSSPSPPAPNPSHHQSFPMSQLFA